MPRKARDYRAEEARRNERARRLGFSSRAQMRRAIEKQTFLPARKGATIVGRAAGPVIPNYIRAGFDTESDYRRARGEAAAWSAQHSRLAASRYRPSFEGDKFRRYYDAFVNDSTKANRIENDLYALEDWLVDEIGYYTPEEFDDKYRKL